MSENPGEESSAADTTAPWTMPPAIPWPAAAHAHEQTTPGAPTPADTSSGAGQSYDTTAGAPAGEAEFAPDAGGYPPPPPMPPSWWVTAPTTQGLGTPGLGTPGLGTPGPGGPGFGTPGDPVMPPQRSEMSSEPPQPMMDAPPAAYGQGQFAPTVPSPTNPATWGWRGRVRKLTGGVISPSMGITEQRYRTDRARVQRNFTGPRTIVFVNPKGGASTTTSTLMAARTFGVNRGGGVVAWDNNETRGTLGARAMPADHANTARELLENLPLFENNAARVGDLSQYVRGQGPAFFDVLASDDRAEVTGHIDATDVGRLHALFGRFYRLILVDTGNNMRAANWLAAVQAADLLVLTATIRMDAAESALWMLDSLESSVYGPGGLRDKTVTVLAEPAPTYDTKLRAAMLGVFGTRTRAVCEIPFDAALVDGWVIDYERIAMRSHMAWLHACAEMADAMAANQAPIGPSGASAQPPPLG